MTNRTIRSIALVTNPLSGAGKGALVAVDAANGFAARGIEVTELCGDSAADTERLVRAALADPVTRPDAVVAAGGDGLVGVVLQALVGTGVPLGLVPGGTGNDLAREVGVPDGTDAAIDVVLGGRTRTIDLGAVETEAGASPTWFATVTGTGLDARVTLRANHMRWPKGPLRYTAAALIELAGKLAVPYRIELHGSPDHRDGTVFELPAVMVAVGNTRTYGGGMLICPDAVIDDGLLDLTVVGAMSRLDMLRLLPALSSGKRIDHPATVQYRAARIKLTAPDAPATADGDPAGMLPATFRALPGALEVLVP
ncbi:diacylglycerol/lipid kinase family protein [Nocardia huaxiensis]|uniref:YegS/Rv2252/BmrU family lipid kinase n=1 Tax=Nocardia huaxiensis TaxID=2755382 RepID=A0A7D6Z3N4_9NOCA|nr:YegS/Rv2252/BmrU family lipid kinase [Nocardia huaxiensis]QLY30244.1 YegS/Rv2252/BmrU family lipid kinase [Nocardia huaxiensis]UFS96136.1 YegS/Rv2252/BmrU family lipid kinase [Nocardia huaxiensis]